jgi:hypothetical protein
MSMYIVTTPIHMKINKVTIACFVDFLRAAGKVYFRRVNILVVTKPHQSALK